MKPEPFKRMAEAVIFTLCLPFYAVAYPFTAGAERRFARKIEGIDCPACGNPITGIDPRKLMVEGVRLRLFAGASVKWDRLPHKSLECPRCRERVCFDRRGRITACDLSDIW
jgi:hypothetical protein